jgi:DNA repair protein RecN (Recombination protein N)
VSDIVAFGEEAQRKLLHMERRDSELERLNTEIDKTEQDLLHAGNNLSRQRRNMLPRLSKAVVKELCALGFKQSCFDVAISSEPELTLRSGRFAMTGFDTVEFQFAPNPGEVPRPLRSIASSGEMARIMLALKTVLAAVDRIPVLVFDEVDANVGGETAQTVGQKMEQISRQRQVICITHLAQVAAQASAHFVVNKEIKEGRTYSDITLLGKKQRVAELARMLGGQSEAATKHAESLLK